MIFVDTSAWFAISYEGDRHNTAAKKLIKDADATVTTDHVLVETWLLINSRFGHHRADMFWRRISGLPVAFEIVTRNDLEAARAIADTFRDQSFSIVDVSSFVVMERLGVACVISFDDDFLIYRYGAQRDRAFEVLR